jgi:RNA polymerase sigma factor (sigma-70 family)
MVLADLVGRAQGGDAEAYTELVRRFQDAVYATAYQTVLDADVARDIAQETFVRAYQALARLRRPESFPAWIVRICRNLATDWLRRPERRWVPLDEASPAESDPAATAAARDMVNRALAALPNDSRLALALFLVDGYTYSEVAGLTGVPVTTVKGRIERARRRLATEMVGMVEDTLKGSAPDEGFALEAVRESLAKARDALEKKELGDARAVAEEALTALASIEENASERDHLRLEALGVVRDATFFPDSERWSEAMRETIALADASDDKDTELWKAWLSHLLYEQALHDRKLSDEERAAVQERALKLFEETGQTVMMGQALFFRGWHRIGGGEFETGFADLGQARAAMKDEPYNSWHACLDASAEFERLTRGQLDTERRVAWGATCDVMVVDGDRLAHRGQPGFSSSSGTLAEMMKGAEPFTQLLWQVGWFPHQGPEPGFEEEKPAFSYTANPTHARIWVEIGDAPVGTPAGTFEGCLLLRMTQTESPLDVETGSPEKNHNSIWCGEKWCWFARGVGPVAYRAERTDGIVEHAVLSRFECPEQRDEWVPLVVGTRWEYVPAEPAEDLDALMVSWLSHVDDQGTWYMPHTVVANRHEPSP